MAWQCLSSLFTWLTGKLLWLTLKTKGLSCYSDTMLCTFKDGLFFSINGFLVLFFHFPFDHIAKNLAQFSLAVVCLNLISIAVRNVWPVIHTFSWNLPFSLTSFSHALLGWRTGREWRSSLPSPNLQIFVSCLVSWRLTRWSSFLSGAASIAWMP